MTTTYASFVQTARRKSPALIYATDAVLNAAMYYHRLDHKGGMMKQQLDSRLITLPSGQIIGSPITRRELKRQLRQRRLGRRALRREARSIGLSYVAAGKLPIDEQRVKEAGL